MNILHIAAHLGGGAGKAITGLACECIQFGVNQKIVILELPEKQVHVENARNADIEVILLKDKIQLIQLLSWSDVTVVSWWNHPLMSKLFAEWPDQECRLALWSHVNGCVYPYLPYKFVTLFERLFVTTKYTFENPLWTIKEKKEIENKSKLIHGMGKFNLKKMDFKDNYNIKDRFVIGYAGTIDYSKIHPRFLEYCKSVIEVVPNVLFLMVGDASPTILKQVKENRLEDFFSFVGYQDNMSAYYLKMDIFGYILRDDNYATTENAILEAMSSALPVVAKDNKPESYIIHNDITGCLIHNEAEYAQVIKKLYDDENLRKQIGIGARNFVIENYSSVNNANKMFCELQLINEKERKTYSISKYMGETPYKWFCRFTGKDDFENVLNRPYKERKEFLENLQTIYLGKTKSSIQHFAQYYPEDKDLSKMSSEVKNLEGTTPGGVRQPLVEILPLEMPLLVQIFPVYGCNFKCGYCIHSLERQQHGYISDETLMPWDLYCKTVDDIKESGKKIKMLRFAAIGEPLLHPQIAEMVAYAKKADIADSIDIVTNGSLLTHELSNRLIEAGLSKLRISLEGLSSEEYLEHALAKVNFEDFVENIRYFYEHCGNTKMYIKIIDYMVQSKELKEKFYKIFEPITHDIAIEHLTPTLKEIDYDIVSNGMKTDKPQNGENLLEAQVCPQPFYMMQINPDGNVIPCCSMHYPEVMGNIRKQRIQEIWNGKEYKEFCKALLNGVKNMDNECRECKLYLYDLHEEDRLDENIDYIKTLY